MADTEHYMRDDVRAFLTMLEQIGGKGVEEVGHIAGREQMRARERAPMPATDHVMPATDHVHTHTRDTFDRHMPTRTCTRSTD